MGGFVYFIEGVTGPDAGKLTAVGLDYAFDDPNDATWRGSGAVGGAGRGGQLVGIGKAVMAKPAGLSWQQSRNKKYWIGWDPVSMPGENDLAREVRLGGHGVEMGDGDKWLIPVARSFGAGTALPQTLMLGAGGELVTEPIAKYAAFGQRAEELWADVRVELGWVEGDRKLDAVTRMRLLVDAMAFNYRVGVDEVNILKLLASDKIADALGAIVDMPAIYARAAELVDVDNKKKVDADSGT